MSNQHFSPPSTLLIEGTTKVSKPTSKAPLLPSSSSTSIAWHQIYDAWSWYNDCSVADCPKQHICVVWKRADHKAIGCRKRKFPVPTCRPDQPTRDCLAPPSPTLPWSPASECFLRPSSFIANPPGQLLSSSTSPRLPVKFSLIWQQITLHTRLQSASGPNAFTLCIPVPSKLNISEWRHCLGTYHDKHLCDFLEFGWPVGYSRPQLPASLSKNYSSASSSPGVIDTFLDCECELGDTCAPFLSNPLSTELIMSPVQVAYSRSGKPRTVVDVNFPHGQSVNARISSSIYLGEPFKLCLPGIDALLYMIRLKGRLCHLFKVDLSRTYRQLRVDPRDYHLHGYRHRGLLYFDIAPPFGF